MCNFHSYLSGRINTEATRHNKARRCQIRHSCATRRKLRTYRRIAKITRPDPTGGTSSRIDVFSSGLVETCTRIGTGNKGQRVLPRSMVSFEFTICCGEHNRANDDGEHCRWYNFVKKDYITIVVRLFDILIICTILKKFTENFK